jgi:archaellum biogenesis protein FlaJ (TadC family)
MTLKKTLIVLVPSLLFSAYHFITGNMLTGLLTIAIAVGVMFLFAFLSRDRVPTKVDLPLVTTILHMHALSMGHVGPKDLVGTIADTEEYGFYSKIFQTIRSLAKKFGYGFTKATAQVAETAKSPLREILVRCTTVFSSEEPEEYLQMESTTLMEEYSGYYLRSIETLKMIGGVFTAFQSVTVFMVMTLSIMTVFMADPDIVVYSYFISAISLVMMCWMFKSVSPDDKTVHIGKFPPRSYLYIKRSLLVTLPISTVAAFLVYLSWGPAFAFMTIGMGMLVPGVIAYKFESHVFSIDDNYPTFLKALGENLASTSDLKAALSYILYMELGPLKKLIQSTLSRLKLGLSRDISLETLSSEAASHQAYISNKILLDALDQGAEPLKVGNLLGNRVVKFLEFRKKRETVARGFQITILVMQPIVVVLLVILTTLSTYLSGSLHSLPFLGFAPIPLEVVEIGNILLIIVTAIINALSMKEIKGGFWGTFLLNLGLLFILSGGAWIATHQLAEMMLGQLPGIEFFPIPGV